ncbi:MAG: outer membrane beta-barrel protein [Myxococcota bacterium]|jgi:hypothetical protein|nr:outer membrane beta-barrel protein [Myxococcota bacterium]
MAHSAHAQPKENGLYLGGFLQSALGTHIQDSDEQKMLESLKQAEIAAYWRFMDKGLLGFELEYDPAKFSNHQVSDLSTAQMANKILEVAYLEWKESFIGLRLGKVVSDVGVEGLDIIERLAWEKSPVPNPNTYSGAFVSAYLPWNLELYGGATLGWDTLWNKNDAISPIVGLKHKSPQERAGLAYHSNLSFMIGPEQRDNKEDHRWLVDYSVGINMGETSEVLFELLYGQEAGLGYDGQSGAPDPNKAAAFWAGLTSFEYAFSQSQSSIVQPLAIGQRLEYIRDKDMLWGWFPEDISGLTTQIASTTTIRYRLHDWIDLMLDYRADFGRGDVQNVSILRNIDAFPEVWNMGQWYQSHQFVFGVVGLFSTRIN